MLKQHILAGIYFIFPKRYPDQTWKFFKTEFGPQQKDRKISYQVRQNLALFFILVALILGWNCVKCLLVTKIVQKINFTEVWRRMEERHCFQRHPCIKYLRQNLVFMWNSTLRENLNFCFPTFFYQDQLNFYFWRKNGH